MVLVSQAEEKANVIIRGTRHHPWRKEAIAARVVMKTPKSPLPLPDIHPVMAETAPKSALTSIILMDPPVKARERTDPTPAKLVMRN